MALGAFPPKYILGAFPPIIKLGDFSPRPCKGIAAPDTGIPWIRGNAAWKLMFANADQRILSLNW